MTERKPNAHTLNRPVPTTDEQRLTYCLASALKFKSEDDALTWADCLSTFGVLKGELTTTQTTDDSDTWYLEYLYEDSQTHPLLVADPDS